MTTVAVPARSARRLILGAAVCLALGLAGSVGADRARFVPWKEPVAPPLALNDLTGQAHTLADYGNHVIRSVNTEQTATLAALRQRMQALKPGAPVTLQIQREGRLMYVSFTLE